MRADPRTDPREGARPAEGVSPRGRVQGLLIVAFVVLVPVILWQTAFRGGWVSDQQPVREGTVRVASCHPTLLPAAGYSCRGRVTWAPESTWVNPKDAKLTRDADVTVFSSAPLTGDAPVATRLWTQSGKASSREVEIILPSAVAHTATPLWWGILAMGYVVLVIGTLVIGGLAALIHKRSSGSSSAIPTTTRLASPR